MSTLHILNGEGTAGGFRQSGIEGDIAVWNEALVEGPVSEEFGSDQFFLQRQAFISEEWGGKRAKYNEIVSAEFAKIRKFRSYNEVILWFEYDLFCQVNMIGLLSWFHKESANELSLVCINSFPGHDDFRGLGQLSPADYPQLLHKKQALISGDLLFATQIWQAYTSTNAFDLQELMTETDTCTAFPFLNRALHEHFRRFPSTENGLNALEQQVTQMVSTSEVGKKQVVMQLMDTNPVLGYGDSQYFSLLASMKPLLENGEVLALNDRGKAVMAGEIDYLDINDKIRFIGGASNIDFRWNGSALENSQ